MQIKKRLTHIEHVNFREQDEQLAPINPLTVEYAVNTQRDEGAVVALTNTEKTRDLMEKVLDLNQRILDIPIIHKIARHAKQMRLLRKGRVSYLQLIAIGCLAGLQSVAYAADVPCTPDPGFVVCKRITHSGANQTVTLPAGVGKIDVKLWGAGGGGGAGDTGLGGGGGFVRGTLTVTAASALTIVVGSGGGAKSTTAAFGGGGAGGNDTNTTTNLDGGAGGGRSAIRVTTTEHVTAGGGGGAAGNTVNSAATANAQSFAGGGGQHAAWTLGCVAGTAARTGTTTAGGARGTGTTARLGVAGTSLTGGAGGSATAGLSAGGGGGGGFFGGGGGAGQQASASCTTAGTNATNGQAGAGGGGVSNTGTTVTGGVITPGNFQATAGTTDSHYQAGIGEGGAANAAGGNGQVVIQWALPTVTIVKVSEGTTGTYNFTGTNGIAPTTITTTTSGVAVSSTKMTLTAIGATATDIIEAAPEAGVQLTGIACTGMGTGGTATATLASRMVRLNAAATAAGANIVCTFTNKALPKITIIKLSQSVTGTFNFTGTNTFPSTNVTTTIAGKPERSAAISVPAGVATAITETLPAAGSGAGLSDISCAGMGAGGTATIDLTTRKVTLNIAAVAYGANILCTFTNGPLPTITISKISEGGVGTFSFTGTNGLPAQTLTTTTPGVAVSSAPLSVAAANTATVITEAAPTAPMLFKSASCTGIGSGGTATVNTTTRTVSLDTAAIRLLGTKVHCTFVNAPLPTLTIAKISQGGVGSFAFTGTNGVPAQTLTTTTPDVAVMGTTTTLTAARTSTVITETTPTAPMLFQSASCTGMGAGGTAVVNTTNRTVTLDIAATVPGSNIVCTIINAKLPTLTIAKISEGNVGSFSFTGTNGVPAQTLTTTTPGVAVMGTPATLTASRTATNITEGSPAPLLFKSVECTGMGAGGTATVTRATRVVALNAAATAPGANIVCTFVNSPSTIELQALKTASVASTTNAGPISYTLSVLNGGSTTTTGVAATGTYRITDTIPAGMLVTSVTAGVGWTCTRTPSPAFPYLSDGSHKVSCTRFTAIAAGATSTTVVIAGSAPSTGTSVTNTAVLTSVPTDPTCDGINLSGRCSRTVTTPIVQQPSFGSCDTRLFLSQNDATKIYNIDTTTSPFVFTAISETKTGFYNAIGYNPLDNYIYGIDKGNDNLVRIGGDGSVESLGPVGLPTTASEVQAAGVFGPDGKFYVRATGANAINIIDIKTRTSTRVTLSQTIGDTIDFGYHNGLLYGRVSSGTTGGERLVSINPTNGTTTFVGPVRPLPASAWGATNAWGAMVSTPFGVYGASNAGHGFYSFNLTNGVLTKISAVPPTNSNDAAHCTTAPLSLPVDISVTKTDNKTLFVPGQSNTYTMEVRNASGPFGAGAVQVSDPFPAGITSGSWTCAVIEGEVDGANCGAATGIGALNDTAGVPIGAILRYTVTLDVPSTFSGNLVNTVTANPTGDNPDTDPSDNTATDIDEPAPRVTIRKISQGGVGSFAFSGTNGIANHSITTATAGAVASGTVQVLTTPGTATSVTEAAPPAGFVLSDISCTGMPAGGTATPDLPNRTVTLNAAATAVGSNIVCTFTNRKLPTLTIRKISQGGVGSFAFTGTNGIANQSLTTTVAGTGVSGTVQTLTAIGVSTTITEAAPPNGFTLTAASCTGLGAGGVATPDLSNGSVSLNAAATAPGTNIVCTFTNNWQAVVTIRKISQGGVGSFAFTGTNGIANQTITTATAGTAVSGTTQVLTAPGSATSITESPPPAGFVLSDISCTGMAAGGTATPNVLTRMVTLNAAATVAGARIVCTFTNTKSPVLSLNKALPNGRAVSTDQFALRIAGAGGPATVTTTGAGSIATGTATLSSGTVGSVYTLNETASGMPNLAGYVSTFSCTNGLAGGQTPSGSGTSFTVTPVAGDVLNCTISNLTPAITVNKTVTAGQANPVGANALVSFDLTVTNTTANTTALASYRFFEVVPQHTTFTGMSNGTTDCAVGAVAGTLCTITVTNPIVNGTPQVVTIRFTVVSAPPASARRVFNVATPNTTTPPTGCSTTGTVCTTPPTGPACPSGNTCAQVAIPPPALTVDKSVSADQASPVGAGAAVSFDLTVTNTVTGTTAPASYRFFEVVPQHTTFTGISNGTTDCAVGAAAGTLCTITVTNPIVNGTPQVVKVTFATVSPLPAGATRVFNVATNDRTTPPTGCSLPSGTVCTTPPTGPNCPANELCEEVPLTPPVITVNKSVTAGQANPVGANAAVSYDLTVTNATASTTAIAGYQFFEVVPQHTTFTGMSNGTSDCAPGAAAGTLCTITVTNPIVNGTPQVVTMVFTTVSPLPAGATRVFNVATQNTTTPPTGCSLPSGTVCTTPPTGPACPSSNTCAELPITPPAVTVAKSVSAGQANPVDANETVSFDLTVTNTTANTTAPASYRFFEVVPQHTTFTSVTNGTSDCAAGAAAGTLCTITVTNPIVNGTPQVVKVEFTTVSLLPAGATRVFNVATPDTTTPPTGCSLPSGTACTTPPTGPACPSGSICAEVPLTPPVVTIEKSVSVGQANPVAAGAEVSFDLVATNTADNTTAPASYRFFEVVPQHTTFTSIMEGATTDCAVGAAAGTLCTITVTNPIVNGTPQVVKVEFTTVRPLPVGATNVFNVATQNTTTPPTGCSTAGTVCMPPPTDPECPSGNACAEVPLTPPAVTVNKTVSAGQVNPVTTGAVVSFDLTVTNTTASTTEPASYQFFEVVPQHTTFTSITNGTSDCAPGAAAGTLCTITVTNPIVNGTPQVVKVEFTTVSSLPAGETSVFNVATKDVTTPPTGCSLPSGTLCTEPPTGPACPSGNTCAEVEITPPPAITVNKTVSAGQANPVAAGAVVSFDLTVTNTVTGTTAPASYRFFEVVPQHTTFTGMSNGTTDCAVGAAAGTLCTITVTNPIVNGTPRVVTIRFTTVRPLPAGATSVFNVATQNTTTPPTGCSLPSGTVCTEPPTGPDCPTDDVCAQVEITPPMLTVNKTVSAGQTNPVGANAAVSFDLTVTNTAVGTTAPASYQFFEVVPQHTTFTGMSNGTSDCAPGAVAGTLCTITVTNPIVNGISQVVKVEFTTEDSLPEDATSVFNVATEDTTTPPTGCSTTGTVCTTPPTGPACPSGGNTCAEVPLVPGDVVVAKRVTAGQANPVGANAAVSFDLTVTNTVTGTTVPASYRFFEVVPQHTTFTGMSNGTTDCAVGAAAGTLCTITVTNPIVNGTPQVVTIRFTTVSPLPAGATSVFNVATQNTTTPPTGCSTTGTVCTTPPTGPACPSGNTCAELPLVPGDVVVAKRVTAGQANPVGANAAVSFDLTVTNTVTGTTVPAGYQFFEVVPQHTTFTSITNGTSDCAAGAAAGTLCTITVTNPIVNGTPQVVKVEFTTVNPLPAGATRVFNVATQNTTTPPTGCSTTGTVCTTPPTGPACPSGGNTCAELPLVPGDVVVAKRVIAGQANPVGANAAVSFDLTVTNTVAGTTVPASYQFFEVVPQHTTFTSMSNGTSDCEPGAAAGTLCTITVTNPIVNGTPQVVTIRFTTVSSLPAGATRVFNVATQNTTTPPTGCSTTGTVCTTPPTGPACPSGNTCAEVPIAPPAVTVNKTVSAGQANPVAAGAVVSFDLTVTNTTANTTAPASYQFFEVVPQHTTFTGMSNGTTDCAPGAAAGTLCTITVTNPIVNGTPQVVTIRFTTVSPLPAGATRVFNVATQNTTTPPTGCSTTGTVCTTPPTGPACPSGNTCAEVPIAPPAITVAKRVTAGQANPVGANAAVSFDLTVTNTTASTTAPASYRFFEVVPQHTTFTSMSNGTTDCAPGAAAGTLCTITVTNPIVNGTPQVVTMVFTTVSSLPAGATRVFNVATQNTTTPPTGCSTTGTVCTTPPTGPACPSGNTCAEVPIAPPAITVAKRVTAGQANPVAAGAVVSFDLTVTNTTANTTAPASYQFFEVVPQHTTFTSMSNGTTDCAPGAAAGTLCTITVTNPIVNGTPQVVTMVFTTVSPLPAGATRVFNVATQNTTTPPTGCSTTGTVCTTPPTGPACPSGNTCAEVPIAPPAITVAKRVTAGQANPVAAGAAVSFDLTVTNTTANTTAPASYRFFEVVPQHTTFTSMSNGTTDCAPGAAAGTLCTITVTNPIVNGTPQVVTMVFTTVSSLPAGATRVFNVATQNTTTPPTGCSTTGTVCTTPPTGPACPSGNTCAEVPIVPPAITVAKRVTAGQANPVTAGAVVSFDLTVTNTTANTTAPASYQFFEVVPQHTTFTSMSNGTTDCAVGAAAGTLCTITVTNPIVNGTPQVVTMVFTTVSSLPAGATRVFNVATQNTTTPPTGCSTTGTVCTTPPTGPACPSGNTCAEVPIAPPAVTVNKTVSAGQANPVAAGAVVSFDLTVTNTTANTTAPASYQFFEVVPQHTTFTGMSNGTTDCAPGAAAGTLCTITVTNPIVNGTPQVVTMVFTTVSSLPAGATRVFNVATQNTTTPPTGCSTTGTVCTTPPTGPACPSGNTCAEVPIAPPAITVAKRVTAGQANPVAAGAVVSFDLTVTNTTANTTAPASYQFFEVVPQHTTFTSMSNGTTDCAPGAAAGTLCTITVTNPIVNGTPQVVTMVFTTVSPLPAGATRVFNVATQNTTTPPTGCSTTGTVCTTPPTGPACPSGNTCAEVPIAPPAITVAKRVTAGQANPVGANAAVSFDLTVTNTTASTTAPASYQFFEVVPQHTTFTSMSNGTTDCAPGAAAGTLCTITVTNPIVNGTPQVVTMVFTTVSSLPAGATRVFNVATQNTTTPPTGCSTTGTVCTTPPTGPACPSGNTCAEVPIVPPAITVAKRVTAGQANPVGANAAVSFDLTVTNTAVGTTAPASYQFFEVVPQHTTFTSVTNGTTDCAPGAAAGTLCTITVTNPIVNGTPQVVTMVFTTVSALPSGATRVFNVATQNTTTPPTGCSTTGTVCTTPPTGPACPSGNTCAEVPLTPPAVTVNKTVSAGQANPVAAGAVVSFDLTITNTAVGTTAPASYRFFEVVPQHTTFTSVTNGTTDCAVGAAAGMLCTITVTNPIVNGTPQVVTMEFTTVSPLPAGATRVFNVATQNTTTPPTGCSTTGTVCTTPPTGPACPSGGNTCAEVPIAPPAITVAKRVTAGQANPVGANAAVSFDLTVTNTTASTTAPASYRFFEVVPQHTTFTGMSNGTTDCAVGAAAGTLCTITVTNPIVNGTPQVVTMVFTTVSSLPAGATRVFNVATQNTTTPPTGCSTTGTVCTTPPTGPACPSGNTCAEVPITPPAVTVNKTVSAGQANPVTAGAVVSFDLTVTNTTASTTAPASYRFFEVVPQHTTFTGMSNGTTDCAPGAAAGTLCTITVTNPIVNGTPQVVTIRFTTVSALPAGATRVFNVATQNTTTPPTGCSTTGTVCTTPPTGPACPSGNTCAEVPIMPPAITVAKRVTAGQANPVGANAAVSFDLTVTNTAVGTTAPASYQFFEVVPQHTTFTSVTNGTTDCAPGAAAGTLCTITVTNPIVNGTPQVVTIRFTTVSALPAGATRVFNVATQNTITPPTGCSTTGTVCTTPPTGPACPSGNTCAEVPITPPAVTVNKTVSAGQANPVTAGAVVSFDLTVTNTAVGTTAPASYQFFEVVPQHTTFTGMSNGTTDCAVGAAAGTLCTITVTNPIVNGTPQVVTMVFTTVSALPSGATRVFNVATQNTTTPPTGCSTTGTVCTTPPTGPACPSGNTCAEVPITPPAVTVNKTVSAGQANPVGANAAVSFDLTVTNTVTGTTAPASYQFFEVVPQHTTFTGMSNGTTDCAVGAAAGTLCTITVTNPIVNGTPQVVTMVFTTVSALPSGATRVFNVATQNTTTPPTGCSTTGTVCTTPPTGPACPSGNTCAEVPIAPPAITVAKRVTAGQANPVGANAAVSFDLTVTNTTASTTAPASYRFFEVVPQHTTFTGMSNGTTDCAVGAAAGTLCTITVTNPIVNGTPQVVTMVFTTVSLLPAGATRVFNVATQNTTTPPTGCSTTGTVCTTPPTGPACPSGNTCAEVPIVPPAITVAKRVTAGQANPVGANAAVSFDLTVTNTTASTTAPASYRFFEVVPQHTTFTGMSNGTTDCAPGAAAGTLCTITVTNPIVNGTPQVVTIRFTTVSALPSGATRVFNVATQNTTTPPTGCSTTGTVCTTPPTGPACPSGNTCAEVPIVPPAITVAKRVTAGQANPVGANAAVSFDLTVTNTAVGTTAPASYQFFEVVPQHTTFTSVTNGTTDCAVGAAAGTLCTITVTNPIVNGTPQVVTIRFTTVSALPAGATRVFNVATQNTTTPPTGCSTTGTVCTTPPTGPACPSGNTCAEVPITPPAVTVNKTVSAGQANPVGANAAVSFDLTVTNTVTGTTVPASYQFFEVVPQHTTFTGMSNGTTDCAVGAAAGTLCTITVTNPIVNGTPQVVTMVFTTVSLLPAGATRVFNVATQNTTTPPTGCSTTGTVCTTPPTGPACPSGNTCAEVPIVPPAITVAKRVTAGQANPVGANAAVSFDLTVTNTAVGTTAPASYQFFEVVPQHTTFTSVTNGTTDCAPGAAAGTLCTITVTNPIVNGTPQVVTIRFTTVSALPAGAMRVFNVATQNTTTPPTGCSTTDTVCTTPPTGPACPSGNTCAEVPIVPPAITVAKRVTAGQANPVGANAAVSFDLTVTNTAVGTTAPASYRFFEVVPQHTTFTGMSNGTTDCAVGAAAGTLCTITVTNPIVNGTPQVVTIRFTTVSALPSGATRVFNVATQNTTTPPTGCSTTGTVCTTPPTGPACPSGNTCAEVPLVPGNVVVAKSVTAGQANPVGANAAVSFDLTVTNTVTGTTVPASYQFFEVVPQHTTFTGMSNGTTDCAVGAAAGTLCTITVTNPIVNGTPQVVTLRFTTVSPLPAGATRVFNVATQNTTTPPTGCSTTDTVCTTPPTGPACPSGNTCAEVPIVPPAITVAKRVTAGQANPVGANAAVSFDLTVTNTAVGTTAPASYRFFEVVPQHTTFTGMSNGTTDCAVGAAAGTLCTITVTNPIVNGTPQVVTIRFTTVSALPSGATRVFNVATQNTTTPPTGCSTTGTVCTTPPTGPACPSGNTCAEVPIAPPAITVAKSVTAGQANPVAAGAVVSFDLTVTNTTASTTAPASYRFFEVVPQHTTFTGMSNGTTDCAVGAAAGTLCTITVTNPIVNGTPQVVTIRFTTVSPLPAGATRVFNVATQNTTTPPTGCSTTDTVCTTPPTGPACPSGGNTCAEVPIVMPNLLDPPFIKKTVTVGNGKTLIWTITVDNNQNAVTQLVQIRDPMPSGMNFVSGSIACHAFGASTVSSCDYDVANNRVISDAALVSDVGVADPNSGPNRVELIFTAEYVTDPIPVTNIAQACYDSNNQQSNVSTCVENVSSSVNHTPLLPVPLDPYWIRCMLLLIAGLGLRALSKQRVRG